MPPIQLSDQSRRQTSGLVLCGFLLMSLMSSSTVRATEERTISVKPINDFNASSSLALGHVLTVAHATTDSADLDTEPEDQASQETETEAVPYTSLPETVRASAEKELGGKGDYRASKYLDHGIPMYQVSAIKDGLGAELVFTEEGELTFATREIPFSKLPAAVQASLRKQHPDRKFTTIQAVTAHAYTASYINEQEGQEVEIKVEPSGLMDNETGISGDTPDKLQ